MNASGVLPSLPPQARLLLVRLRSIGDIVLMTPALRMLKEWRPDLRVSVVIEPQFEDLLKGNPDVEEILAPGEGRGLSKLLARFSAARRIRARGFDLAVNLHGGPTSLWLTRLSGARVKAAFAHFRSRSAYDILIPDALEILNAQSIHTAEHHAAALFYLGLPRREIPRARLFVTSEAAEWWDAAKQDADLKPAQDYAVIHPTASYQTKEWALEKFAELGKWLERERGLPVVYTFGPEEWNAYDSLYGCLGHPVTWLKGPGGAIAFHDADAHPVRRFMCDTLSQFAAILAGARIFIGNDSGPAHMAAALARPSVVIFGSSSSKIWGPWPRDTSGYSARVVQNPYDCNPCPGDRCYRYERPECILSVRLEQVEEAVETVLAARLQVEDPSCGAAPGDSQ